MDTLTHGLLGAATAQLGFRQRIGGGATWAAAATAMLVDLDMLVRPILRLAGVEPDGYAAIGYHRGLSHSLLLAPVIALLVAWLWHRAGGGVPPAQVKPGPLVDKVTHPEVVAKALAQSASPEPKGPSFALRYLCLLVAAVIHPVLDWCTSYGTEILAPVTNVRYALDVVPIIDIIYTPILILTLLACYAARKLGADGAQRATLVIGWTGFILSVGYLVAGRVMHDRAADRALQLASQTGVLARSGPHQGAKVNAYPYVGTIFLWRTTVETPKSWMAARIRPLRELDARDVPHNVIRKVSNVWISRAERLEEIQAFTRFAMDQTRATYKRMSGRHVVEFHDMRYGVRPESTESLWPTRVTFDRTGKLLSVERIRHFGLRGRRRMLKKVWEEIWR